MDKKVFNFKNCLLLITFALVGFWVVNNMDIVGNILGFIWKIIFPFILGGALAFLLNIPMTFFERKCKKIKNKTILRVMSLIFAILVIVLVITLVITLILPELVDIAKLLIDNIPHFVEQINELINKFEGDIPELKDFSLNSENLKNEVMAYIPELLTSSVSIISNVVMAVANFFIAVIFSIYILLDKEKLQRQLTKVIQAYLPKERANRIMKFGSEANIVFRKFFTVQCLEATILGVLCIIGMWIFRIPYAMPIGILIGVTALVPIVGAFLGIIIGAILIVSVAPIKVITFIVFVLILQQIEGNIIYPKVVGSSVGLPGIWVLVAVTLGGSLGGILGMLIGVPIATTVYNLVSRDVNKKLE